MDGDTLSVIRLAGVVGCVDFCFHHVAGRAVAMYWRYVVDWAQLGDIYWQRVVSQSGGLSDEYLIVVRMVSVTPSIPLSSLLGLLTCLLL